MTRALHHVALGARDVARVAAFYVDFLGLVEQTRHFYPDGQLRSIWLDMCATVLMVEHTEWTTTPAPAGVRPGFFLLAFQVDGPQARRELEARLVAAGHPIEAQTAFTTYFRDPEGNRVALSHYAID